MTKKTFLGAMAVVTAVALTGTALVASNMGFKLNYALGQPLVGGPNDNGTNALALPDNRQAGLGDAQLLMNDIGFASVTNVQRYLKSNNSFQTYTGRKNVGGPLSFPLASGEGYMVRMATTVNYIAVGSDDPSLAYALGQPLLGGPNDNGTNFFAYNYHQTAVDAQGLMNDIGFANVTNVQRYLKSNNSFQTYTGRKNVGGPLSFPLAPGEAYMVRMATTVNYTPSHY